ncbi:MAG: 3-deoxy-D-manno-octulosonic acid transferase [Gammaproteobacteria bacterium]|nr:3-deoxy-D-manno-octulosonic acid transferase [Gammaproteobacteria bacterium]
MNFARATYTTTLRLATPVLLAHLARRTRRQTDMRDDWRARLGYATADARRPIWIHAASAGEMQAALALAGKLAEQYPLRLSAFSASGLARAHACLPETTASLAPLDLPGAWRRFLTRTRPRLLILTETELWPNLLAAADAHGVPAVLASARLTPAAAGRLARFPKTSRQMMRQLAAVLAQTGADLARYQALGLPADRGRVTGNLKTSLSIPASVLEHAQGLRAGPLAGRKAWVAGSAREGEEAFIAEATARLHRLNAGVVSLIVPRHPEKARDFDAALRARGVATTGAEALDHDRPIAAGTAVVVDRLGILLELYAACDATFVGGSIAPLGGHNLLEPALLARPILAGPHLENVREDAARLEKAGALVIVSDAAPMAEALHALLADPELCKRKGEAARRAVSTADALAATLAALAAYLGKPDSGQPSAGAG